MSDDFYDDIEVEADDSTRSPLLTRLLNRAANILVCLLVVIVLLFPALWGFFPATTNTDIGWHLAAAKLMVEQGSALFQEPFNYPYLGEPIIHEYPFYHLLLYAGYLGGDVGLALLSSLLIVSLYALWLWAGWKWHVPFALLAPALVLGFPLIILRYGLRPETMSYLFTVATALLLLRGVGRKTMSEMWTVVWPLPFIMALWVNSHSGFLVGLGLVGFFAAEMIIRDTVSRINELRASHPAHGIAWSTLYTRTVREALPWISVVGIVCAASFINPFGLDRLSVPLQLHGHETIRAYTTEMQGFPFAWTNVFWQVQLMLLAWMLVSAVVYRFQISWAIVLLSVLFVLETAHSQRHIGQLPAFAPCAVISAAVLGNPLRFVSGFSLRLLQTTILIVSLCGGLLALTLRLNPESPHYITTPWESLEKYHHRRPAKAVEWMKANGITDDRLIHRAEDGGYLQLMGYNRGQTFGDTIFGRMKVEWVAELCRVSERPGNVKNMVQKYGPKFAVLGGMSFRWPTTLREDGWRCIFFDPGGSVWTYGDIRPDLPTQAPEDMARSFRADLELYGYPVRPNVFYRRVLHLLHSGAPQAAFEEYLKYYEVQKNQTGYWDIAYRMAGYLSEKQLESLKTFAHKLIEENGPEYARQIEEDFLFPLSVQQREPDAMERLSALPRHKLNHGEAMALARYFLDKNELEEALTLLRNDSLHDLKNGDRFALLAQAEIAVGNNEAGAAALEQALFFHGDAAHIQEQAAEFLADKPSNAFPQLRDRLNQLKRD